MSKFDLYSLSFPRRAVLALILSCWLAVPAFSQVSISGIINTYTKVTSIYQPNCNACDLGCINTITIDDPTGINAGDKLLIIQMKGATIDVTNSPTGGSISAIGNAGNYEFFEIADITGNIITPRFPLIRKYDAAGLIQVVKIPQYNQSVTVVDTLKALDWDDAVGIGGVVALYARKLTLNAPIYVLGAGYRGVLMSVNGTPDNCGVDPETQYVLPATNASSYTKGQGIVVDDVNTNRGRAPRGNGGGSGVSGDSGGGGGSNYGAGGDGGLRWCDEGPGGNDDAAYALAGGKGGISLLTYLQQDRVFLGGAGGPGWVSTNNPSRATDGGGIVIIFADTLVGNGKDIIASGIDGQAINPVGAPDGGGGGGGGGTIVLKVPTYVGTVNLFADGGDGQDLNTNDHHGPGGGGGGGSILYSLPALPATVNYTVAGGIGGQHPDGFRNVSQDGGVGGTVSLYVPIQNPSYEFALDNDGIQNLCDIDDDNDGILDVREAYSGDHDTDGIVDWNDPEFCAATFEGVNGWVCATMGLPDPGGDMDGDSRPNFKDPNFPYCGTLLAGSICSSLDNDRDAVPNHLDLDSDNDGITDIIESGGIDVNGDGFSDDTGDDDADGLVNLYDADCTGAVVSGRGSALIAVSGTVNSQGNIVDVSSATFGTLEVSGSYADIALQQALPAGTTVTVRLSRNGGAGFATGNILQSFDGTAFANSQAYSVDLTPTNISYVLTATTRVIRVITTNAEQTGVYLVSYTYTSCAGLPGATMPVVNSDGDAIVNFLDRDSDNDGIPDVIEANGIDSDGDGQLDNIQDADEDGYADQLDPDDDGSAGIDAGESTDPLVRTTADIGADGFTGDGETLVEGDGSTSQDTDGDGKYDWLEIDSDNDGITDILEVGDADLNQDGLVDGYTDVDRDGFSDNNDPDNDGTLGIDVGGASDPSITTGIDLANDAKSNDNEGFNSPAGYAVNPDNANIPNFQDIDADDDGIVDNNEAQATAAYILPVGTDTDGDGLDNAYDPTNGGTYLVPVNTESTGFPDYLDLTSEDDAQSDIIEGHDSDNNAIPDAGSPADTGVATGNDTDNDGLDDGYDNDDTRINPTNGTGVAHLSNGLAPLSYPNLDQVGTPERDWREGVRDNDSDGIADALDLDDDNDGIPDVQEACGVAATDYSCYAATLNNGAGVGLDPMADEDNDNIPNYVDKFDNDGGSDFVNTCTDANADGVCDQTAIFPAFDKDLDGILNQFDLDADNDGLTDIYEAGGIDINGDGRVDVFVDTDNDGWQDIYDNTGGSVTSGTRLPLTNSDRDGLPNYLDLDADNDGIPDLIEAGGIDSNGDGQVDDNGSANGDNDGDGYADVYDSDDDGATGIDAGEDQQPLVRTAADISADGRADDGEVIYAGDGATRQDSDRDGLVDWLDLDTDNDGLTDIVEAGGTDTNGDGYGDVSTDADADGFFDTYDPDDDGSVGVDPLESGAPMVRTSADAGTNDGKVNGTEIYTDGDGITSRDMDRDGQPGWLDLDTDNDGITDLIEARGTDTDGDGRVDTYTDADNDGYAARYDSDDNNDGTIDGATDPIVLTSADANSNGKVDNAETYTRGDAVSHSPDGDRIPGWLDLDSDDDAITDLIEAGGVDADGDGRVDTYTDADNDGYTDQFDSDDDGTAGIEDTTDPLVRITGDANTNSKVDGADSFVSGTGVSLNPEADGLPNWLDIDSDNDGITDIIESGGTDSDLDGRINWSLNVDADLDGYGDSFDPDDDGVAGIDAGEGDEPNVRTSTDVNADLKSNDGEAFLSPTGYPVNGDADVFPNFQDIDADNDGIVDYVEGQRTTPFIAFVATDTDGDGLVNVYDPTNGGTYLIPTNTEATGNPDYLDLNSDDDSQLDAVEGHDSDNNGTADAGSNALNGVPTGADTDNDGLDDGYDNAIGTFNPTNGTTPTSYFLLDGGADRDWRAATSLDQDGDGISNTNDLDDDNDGLTDLRETCGIAAVSYSCLNAILHISNVGVDPTADTDGDGRPNYLDKTPSGTITNICDDLSPIDDVCDVINPIFDKDGDGVPNFYDRDSDNDGITDVVENGLVDSDGNGVVDNVTDRNLNGVGDLFDATCNGAVVARRAAAVAGTVGTPLNPNNAVDNDNATFSELEDATDEIDLELQDIIPTGTVVTIRVLRTGGTNTTTGEVFQSANDNTYASIGTFTVNNTSADQTFSVTADTRYIRVVSTNARNFGVYFLSYSVTSCNGNLGTAATPLDRDGDTYLDYLDLDADNDGIPDITEAGGSDYDGDGRVDNDNDGDSDGYADLYDSDDDGSNGLDAGEDQQPLVRTSGDAFNDGFVNSTDYLVKGNGSTRQDTDGDGKPDWLDLDADNDGITDVVEVGGTDSNGDGRADITTDADNDGYVDIYDSDDNGTAGVDLGEESQPLVRASLDNGDGKVNGTEGFLKGDGNTRQDSDRDGYANWLDLDTDNDGITDIVEAGGIDTNGDGTVETATDADNDGYADIYDSDDDGAAGIEDTNDPLVRTNGDAGSDGKVNSTDYLAEGDGNTRQDSDRDGYADWLDLDADNDGLTDITEAGGTDTDGDGKVDVATDADNDGYADRYDSDDDGSAGPEDTNDPLVRTNGDSGSDGKVNGTDYLAEGDGNTRQDSDRDGLADWLDLDTDNDGITDIIEAWGIDANGDGKVDVTTDGDNDGYADIYDSDDDGTPGVDTSEDTQPLVRASTDSNNNGKVDGAERFNQGDGATNQDSDRDGRPDFLDLDSDNDGITDLIEAGGTDSDGQGTVEITTDADLDGYADVYDSDDNNDGTMDGASQPLVRTSGDAGSDGKLNGGDIRTEGDGNTRQDVDNDGRNDWLDLDADNDGIPDLVEVGGADNNNDGLVDIVTDTDNDGYADIYDSDNDGTTGVDAGASTQPLVMSRADVALDGKVTLADGARITWYPLEVSSDQNPADTDRDGIINAYDADSDGDGVTDPMDINGGTMPAGFTNQGIVTTLVDANNNGWQDALEGVNVILDPNTDSDTDGLADQGYAAADDFDRDLRANAYDIDADNDGILDSDEVQQSNSTSLPGGSDSDLDGIDNAFDPDNGGTPVTAPANIDGVIGTPDFLDLDTDDDGSRDWIEGFDSNDANVDALTEYAAKMEAWRSANCPGAVAQCAVYSNAVDVDGDGYPAWGDLNDAVFSSNNGTNYMPPFLDATNGTYYFDTDKDGLIDIFDLATGGASTEPENGVSSISAQAPAAPTTLIPDYRNALPTVTFPVEWASFEARPVGVDAQLDWATASELNNAYFEVERSADGKTFAKVGQVQGAGTTLGTTTYDFRDLNVASLKTVFYRLYQVDINGKGTYSETRTVTFSATTGISLMPNPAHESCAAAITLPTATPATVRIVDMVGRVMQTMTIDGSTNLRLDISDLAAGVYVVEVATKNEIISARLIVE